MSKFEFDLVLWYRMIKYWNFPFYLFCKMKQGIKNEKMEIKKNVKLMIRLERKKPKLCRHNQLWRLTLYRYIWLRIAEQTCKTIMTKTSYALLELRWLLQLAEDQNRVLFSKEGVTHDSM